MLYKKSLEDSISIAQCLLCVSRAGEFLYVMAILFYALSISINRVIRSEISEDNTAKRKADDSAVPMYTATASTSTAPPDYKEKSGSTSSQQAAADAAPEQQKMAPKPKVYRSESPTSSEFGCPAGGYDENTDGEQVPLHPGRRKSLGALLWEKMPVFVITAIVVLVAIILRLLSPLYT